MSGANKKRPDNRRPILYVLLIKYGLKGAFQILKEDIWFDVINRTNTAAPVSQSRLFTPGNRSEQNRYVASTFRVLQAVTDFAASQVDLTQCGFLDLGSGKGKALIAASRYPYRSIRGIDTSKLMHKIATKNLRRMGIESRVELVNDSAANLRLLPHERVLYFFNSFSGKVLDHCLQAISNGYRDGSGLLIYVNPTEHEHIERYFPLLHSEFIQPGNCEVNYYTLPAKKCH